MSGSALESMTLLVDFIEHRRKSESKTNTTSLKLKDEQKWAGNANDDKIL